MLRKELAAWIDELHHLEAEGRLREAIERAKSVLRSDRTDINVRSIASSSLIDIGTRLDDMSAAREGMDLARELLAEPAIDESDRLTWQYNLSNGYGTLYKLLYRSGDPTAAREALREQKHLLQDILLRAHHADRTLLPNIHTNYANVLDELNRSIEAIDQYARAWSLDPRHMVAKGNCGEALHRLIHATGHHWRENLEAALSLLEDACAAPGEIVSRASPETVLHLERNLELLRTGVEEKINGGVKAFRHWTLHRHKDHGQPRSPAWLSRIVNDRLLLSFNQLPLLSVEEAVDDAFFKKLAYGVDDASEQWSLSLIYLLNAIKKEFVTVRDMYYRAIDRSTSFVRVDGVTEYANPDRFAEFGLAPGLLKASLKGRWIFWTR